MTLRNTSLAALALALTVAALPARAQVSFDEETAYKPKLNTCLTKEDYPCALEVLLNHGANSGRPGVVVPGRKSATLLGAQMFAVLDRAQGKVPDDTYHKMAEAALNYVLDAQPDSATATGPFILLFAEGCLAIEDWNCVRTATQPLQILMSTGGFYITGENNSEGKPDVNTRVINLIQEFNKRSR